MPVSDERQWRRVSSDRSVAALIAMIASAKLGSSAVCLSVMGTAPSGRSSHRDGCK